MKIKQCHILLKYCYNQISYDLFKKLFLKSYNVSPDGDGYLHDKWDHFTRTMVSFLIQHPEFMEHAQQELEKIGYKG